MIDPALLGFIGVAALGLSLSALFSGIETGMYTINRIRLLVLAGRGDRAARRLQAELGQMSRLLITLLIGNNIANYLGSFGCAAVLDHLGVRPGAAVAINALILVPVLFVFGETLPKDLFRSHTDRWSYRWSWFLSGARLIFSYTGLVPLLTIIGRAVTRMVGGGTEDAGTARQRISQLIREGVGAGVLTEAQTSLIDRALSIRARTVESELVPWRQVVTIPLHADETARRSIVAQHNFTRLPVVDDRGEVVGIVSVLDVLLEPNRPIGELLTAAPTLGPTTRILEAIRVIRRHNSGIGIVRDTSRQRPIGIVTLKDLVEPLTGELGAW